MAHICLANLLEEERGKELLLQLVCPAVIHLLSSEGNYDLKLDAISVRYYMSHDQGRNCQNNVGILTCTIFRHNVWATVPVNWWSMNLLKKTSYFYAYNA